MQVDSRKSQFPRHFEFNFHPFQIYNALPLLVESVNDSLLAVDGPARLVSAIERWEGKTHALSFGFQLSRVCDSENKSSFFSFRTSKLHHVVKMT